jgi:hypothetical protein
MHLSEKRKASAIEEDEARGTDEREYEYRIEKVPTALLTK